MVKLKFMQDYFMELTQNVFRLRNKYENDIRIDGKVVVITGANSGIGKETALQLSLRGAKVIIGCRDTEKGEEVINDIKVKNRLANMYAIKLDLSSLQSIRQFVAEVTKRETRIDILINNAGVGGYPQMQTREGFELHFGTNHLGHFLLTLSLLPLLKSASKARVIAVSSNTHRLGRIDFDNINLRNGRYDPMRAYTQSKLANVLFVRELAKRLGAESSVTTYALHPGTIKSRISRNMERGKDIYDIYTGIFYLKPEMGCQTTLYCALEESLDSETGQYYSNCLRDQLWSNALDDNSAERLWNLSCDLVHIEHHLNI